jgi:predicted rRNA methylase YqxC with S4 and FtsJ domains
VHREVLRKASLYAAENGLSPAGVVPSPIKGAKGNTEFLMLIDKGPSND